MGFHGGMKRPDQTGSIVVIKLYRHIIIVLMP